jgi:NAD(P)-dependent dehydrogenase (short-subunit alcohol dehydrogenase family)
MGNQAGSLDGQVVVVTGGTRGVGLGVAHALVARGAKVTITGRKQEALDAALTELSAVGDVLGVAGNVADRDGVFDAVARTVQHFGRVDGLVNNAQTFRPVMPLEAVTARDLDTLFDTGVKATLWGMQAVMPHFRAQGSGRIVNMGSVIGMRGAKGYGPYAASKEAIRGLTRTAALEWAADGVVVNCVCPASAGHRAPPGDPDRIANYAAAYRDHPMGRDGDAIDDIGPVVCFLLSPECRYMTGETLLVDGGSYLRA